MTSGALAFIPGLKAEEPETESFRPYVDRYLKAIATEDAAEIRALTSSENKVIHSANRRIMNEVKGEPYDLWVSPYDGESDIAVMYIEATDGMCQFVTQPEYKLQVSWQFSTEHYTRGHACHEVRMESTSITLFVSTADGQIREVSSCSDDYMPSIAGKSAALSGAGEIALTETQTLAIKAWLAAQENFSRIRSIQHIGGEYGMSMREANTVLNMVCATL